MSSSTPPPQQQQQTEHSEMDDPLNLLEENINDLKDADNEDQLNSVKRKLATDIQNAKKQKTRDESEKIKAESEKENHNPPKADVNAWDESKMMEDVINNEEQDEDLTGNESKMTEKDNKLDEDEVDSKNEAMSKDKKEKKEHEKKVQNLRKNIKEVLDESQLDATTLAAQRQESERLARLQETQRLARETQRQIAAEKHANKTQQKVLSLLGDQSYEPIDSAIDLDDPLFEKLSLNPAISITPASKEALQSIQSLISTDDKVPDSDDDVVIQSEEPAEKSKAVIVDSSSDSDDCIILSDEEEEDLDDDDENNSGEHTNDLYNKHDSEGRVVINVGHNEKESDIFVAPQIARVIKPHQIGGVRFLYDNIIESIELFEKSTGFGCILAHSMGLGKTLQLVCFCDIFLRHTTSKTVLVIMPINTLQNWVNEFNMWIPLPEDVGKCPLKEQGEVRPRNFKIHVLNDSHKSLSIRAKVVMEWKNEGGVLMMGYEMFRLLSLKKVKQKRKKGVAHNLENDVPTSEDQDMFDKIYEALVNPGPDLVVCDEGHRIKNAAASTSLALKQVKTKRRIVLTGYPLQNNLLEYWCMVDFVRPSYLGTKTEFSNMFERPIQNGQCIDSTVQDCKLMRYRAHVLHSLLKGFVQRRSHTVLQKCLPDKTEFVLLIRLTPFQRKLYTVFMDEFIRTKKVPNPLKAFAVCCKIWNHPDVLYNFLKKRELDLEIELEENEGDRKNDSTSNTKKRGRKSKDKEKIKPKSEEEATRSNNKSIDTEEINPIQLEVTKNIPQNLSDTFKPPVTPSSNDSAYSSNQSSNYESSNTYNSYPGYQNYDPYQNYSNYSNGNFSNWNSSGSNPYWQNNYYQNDYYHQPNSYPPYYGNQQSIGTVANAKNPPYNSSADKDNPKIECSTKLPVDKTAKEDGGLLADVIQKETKEQQEKNNSNKDDIADSIVLKSNPRDDGIPYDWAVELMKEYVPDLLESSPKLEIFFCILEESIKLGDRLLVFSQSLLTLNLLEKFLQRSKIPNTDNCWAKNQNYFRLDGSTAALEREKLINEFNSNTNFKLFMVSTRAGSLGINLVGANRVIVFDASWNPCHDTQAICRVYRYGQSKPCYVYRLVVDNCLEKKIYDRQINKQGMADRVIDECNPDAHLSIKEVTSLCYDDGTDPEIQDFTEQLDNYKDLVMQKVLSVFCKALTKEPFQHESLLVDRKEKKLSQAEKRLAQRGYEMEKQAATKNTFGYNNNMGNNYRLFRTPDGTLIQRPVMSNQTHVQPITQNIQSMQAPNQSAPIRAENPRPNRWVPVEVWQSKGIIAQEMTLPQDVSIQTNSADRSKIFLKAGQKIIVLKSPRGICLQLESGKVIAIRASMKPAYNSIPGLPNDLKDSKGISGIIDGSSSNDFSLQSAKPLVGSDDVIDMTNSDDEEDVSGDKKVVGSNTNNTENSSLRENHQETQAAISTNLKSDSIKDEVVFKEKTVYKPNLVQRKPKIMPPPPITTASIPSNNTTATLSQSNYDNQSSSSSYDSSYRWNRYPDKSSNNFASTHSFPETETGSRSTDQPLPYRSSFTPSISSTSRKETTDSDAPRDNPLGNGSSAFHAPSYQNSFMQPPTQFSPHNSYQPYQNNNNNNNNSSSNNSNNNYNYASTNYNYYQPSFSNPSSPYHYPSPHNNFDPQYAYHHGFNQYGTQLLPSSYPNLPPTTSSSTSITPSSSNANYSQWNYSK